MSGFLYVPRPVNRPVPRSVPRTEQVQLKQEMRVLTTQNKLLQQKIISLEKELYAIRTTDSFKRIKELEKKVDDTLREYKQANNEHLRYGKEFVDWMEDTRSKNEELMLRYEELMLKNEELIRENGRLRVENEELKNTRLH